MELKERLARIVDGMPAGGSVSLPVSVLREWLEGAGNDTASRPLSDLTIQDVADELGRSPSTVRGWLIAGDIPEAYKLQQREWRIPRAALRAFLDRQAAGEPRGDLPAGGRRGARLSDWRKAS